MAGLLAVQVSVKLSYGSDSGHDVSRPKKDLGKRSKLLMTGSLKKKSNQRQCFAMFYLLETLRLMILLTLKALVTKLEPEMISTLH